MEELKKAMDAGECVVVNVLPEKYYKKWHIKGSINVSILEEDTFVERMEKAVGGKDKFTVVYCADYDCRASVRAQKMLEEAGWTNVKEYLGGTKEWLEAGLPISGTASE